MGTLINRIGELAEKQPKKTALAFKKEQLTYEQLFERIIGVSEKLKELGINPGDRVCFSALSKPEMVVLYLGIQMCGGIAVFLDKNSTAQNMAMIYEDAESKLLLTDKPMKEYAENCNVFSMKKLYAESITETVCEKRKYSIDPEEDDIAELLFTTGTTGKPKGVILSYKAVYHILTNTINGIGIREDDRVLLPLPLNHSFALRVLRAVLYCGATIILQNGFTFATEIEKNISMYDCTALAAVPASYEVMKSQMQDKFVEVLSKLRYIEFGAGSLSIKQRKEIVSMLPNVQIFNTWGSSETGGAIFCNVNEAVKSKKKIGMLGKCRPSMQMKVIDMEGNTISSNEKNPGKMVLKGAMQMSGYWKMPELTQQTLVDGWLLTGDLVYQDEDGDIFMLGRADDIINVGGEKVAPIDVENVACQYKDIKDCACIGVVDPDGILGQVPVLFMTVDNAYKEQEFVKYLSEHMERYKMPYKYVVLDELPRNRMQKLNRKELHRIWTEQGDTDLMNPVMQTILSRHSVRKFTDQDIPESILNMILKAGYHAPSGHNMQSWRFTVLTDAEDIQKLKESTKVTAENEKVNFYGWENPRVLILVSNDNRNPNGCQDASCASENMMLAANSYGLGAVWLNPLMTLRNVLPVKALLDDYGIPENHTVWATIAIGYPVSNGAALAKRENVIHFV